VSFHRYNMHAGEWEETHVVVSGESLSKIASHYRSQGWTELSDWRPIYRLTRMRTGLWRDQHKPSQLDKPDLIRPGDLLSIPRSRAGYRTVINRINSLIQDNIGAPGYAAELKKQEEHFSENLNFLSDVLVFIGTAGGSAATAARSASVAKLAVGAAAKEALKQKTLSAVEMGLKITEYAAKSTDHENVEKYAKTASKVVHVVDLLHGAKDFRADGKELRLKKEYWKLAGESVGQVVDVIDIALEWTQPSKLSKGLIRLFTGTDVDAEIDKSVEREEVSKEHLARMLVTKVSNLQIEMNLVYPAS
jgi:LysM domain